jgi:Fe-S cluster biogenesis protein NfuA/nitrite reductase/ring-hydroxylating ferredoxin subunit
VEALLGEVESLPDPAARDKALEVVQALVELYGEGLGRIAAGLGAVGGLPTAVVEDELVTHLLLLHDLHPVPVHERVLSALAEVRPYLESHGGDVELAGVEDGVVRLRLQGSCSGCPSSTMTLKLAIEEAIHKAAPDVESIEAEGVAEPPGPALLQIEPMGSSWATADAQADLADGAAALQQVAGEAVLFARLAETLFAYRPACPGCAGLLDETSLHGAELECPGCGRAYDVRRAGRCLDDPQLQLSPVPLLSGDAGTVRVAMA